MSDVLQTNIFFLITSIAIVFVTILVGVVLFYVVMILKDIKEMSEKVKKGMSFLERDFLSFHKVIKKGGTRLQDILSMFGGRFMSSERKKRSTKKKEKEEK